jgi:hypothetical protein
MYISGGKSFLAVDIKAFTTKMIWKTIGCNGFHPSSF